MRLLFATLLGTVDLIPYLGIYVADGPSGLCSKRDHTCGVLFRLLLAHGGISPQHLTLLVTYNISLNSILDFNALYSLLHLALSEHAQRTTDNSKFVFRVPVSKLIIRQRAIGHIKQHC
jgi:hypothetical protein